MKKFWAFVLFCCILAPVRASGADAAPCDLEKTSVDKVNDPATNSRYNECVLMEHVKRIPRDELLYDLDRIEGGNTLANYINCREQDSQRGRCGFYIHDRPEEGLSWTMKYFGVLLDHYIMRDQFGEALNLITQYRYPPEGHAAWADSKFEYAKERFVDKMVESASKSSEEQSVARYRAAWLAARSMSDYLNRIHYAGWDTPGSNGSKSEAYKALIAGLARAGRIDLAWKIFEEMPASVSSEPLSFDVNMHLFDIRKETKKYLDEYALRESTRKIPATTAILPPDTSKIFIER